jgi:mannitol-1-/sugar-/sorbitol-6-phosphatase
MSAAPMSVTFTGIGTFDAVLFDSDGVLVDSMDQVDLCWGEICDRYSLDRETVFGVLHGRPAIETLSQFLTGAVLQRAWEELQDLEVETATATTPMPGAVEMFGALTMRGAHFTVATSATEKLARARLGSAGLTVPATIVCADHVRNGKPAPDPYLLAASRLGVDPVRCAVIEDAPSGIRAGLSAGATVVALRTTHDAGDIGAAHAVARDLAELVELLTA